MIQRKQKICKSCSKFRYIFSRGNCKQCAQKSYKKPRPVSDKRKEQLKDYSVLRKEHLDKYPFCQAGLVGCEVRSTQIHHKNKRHGERLNDTKEWLAVCSKCHDRLEHAMSAAEAIKLGLRTKQ